MSLYLAVLLISLAGPLALSFEKNLRLYKRWKYLLPGILITMIIFVSWDIIFTQMGYWFFNPTHNSGIYLNQLPLEEYLFFIVIPYACAFSFYAVQFHFPKFKINGKWTKFLTFLIVVFSIIFSLLNHDVAYTFVSCLVLPIILLLSYSLAREVVQYYLAIFPILLIPFFIVNGVLTGGYTQKPVVVYNPEEYLGLRITSVPVDDAVYLFLLMLMVTSFYEKFKKKYNIT